MAARVVFPTPVTPRASGSFNTSGTDEMAMRFDDGSSSGILMSFFRVKIWSRIVESVIASVGRILRIILASETDLGKGSPFIFSRTWSAASGGSDSLSSSSCRIT